MKLSPKPLHAEVLNLSPSTRLVAVENGPAYIIRGRDAFVLSDGEWRRLQAMCAGVQETRAA